MLLGCGAVTIYRAGKAIVLDPVRWEGLGRELAPHK